MSKPDASSVTHHRWDQIPAEPLKGTITRRMVTGTRIDDRAYLPQEGRRRTASFA